MVALFTNLRDGDAENTSLNNHSNFQTRVLTVTHRLVHYLTGQPESSDYTDQNFCSIISSTFSRILLLCDRSIDQLTDVTDSLSRQVIGLNYSLSLTISLCLTYWLAGRLTETTEDCALLHAGSYRPKHVANLCNNVIVFTIKVAVFVG